ncbi:MAG: 50S ribosomal protein L18e [Crenarchaeota archaeon]|nr:50S ribosomal protein L18e [Thermoproteota archaeon]
MRESKTTNPELIQLIRNLKKQSREKDARIWIDVAKFLSKPSRQRIAVNLSAINRNTTDQETVIVPGKVLASGTLDHVVTVVSFDVSAEAKTKITAANSKYLSIQELMEQNPTGSKVRIIG